jgi:ectoine hydroxylase-related dioxygenase (phytanoyl-CoA dioxygenase family)
MNVNPQQLLDNGYVVLREVVPPERLEGLRNSFETLVERQKSIWARDRKPEDPPGGIWETNHQPRLSFHTVVDEETASAVEFCLHENTMGVCRQLMRAPEAGAQQFSLMCSPVRDHGPAPWHRDIHPIDQAPLFGLQEDLMVNAPGYLQWNIPLYDDNVLWVVPGSHRRPNTEEENRSLLENSRAPVPGSIPVELKAGDGVVYANTILHWGSNYSSKLRRTIHLGFRAFGGPIYPYVPRFHNDLSFTRHLSLEAQATFQRHGKLYAEECNRIEAVFRAIISKDADAFRAGLASLHPGEQGRMVCVVLLSKLVYKIRFKPSGYGPDISQHEVLGPRFSPAEVETLWARFAPLDARLQSDTEQYVPGFQSRPMRYFFYEMPANFGIEEFIVSWNGAKRSE